LPRKERIPDLQRDYRDMQVMFFQTPPPFHEVLARLAELEREINSLRA